MSGSQNTLVSIITPVYNYERYIAEAIESVLAQTYTNWEMIIVDDRSTDDSPEIVKKYAKKDHRIKLIELPENLGAAMARNKALEHAKGRYIAFLDSDDIWDGRKLAKQIAFMQKNNSPVTFTSYELINENGTRLNHVIHSVKKLSLNDYLKNTIIGFSTAIIDTEQTGSISFMDIKTRSDTQLWITLFKKGFFACGLDEVLVKYRKDHKSLSSNKIKAALQVWRLYYKIENIGLFRSLYSFLFYGINAIKKRM
ncbi:MAG: glycosyltransferase family 2 protein [Bacteroidales bacterium]|nr:glycosyltransferase family 2 protein [Bacteroidales bacterium]